ncbi:heme ABC exporter ATP-binding protein CcmA [Falsiroseomonas selenitidurans]|uniref:Heme ABC exporter ATP-binding protein CcmA n=1 Tax=Falsiroseomonas selenitidurans TaxID=2716335 RepID=A0ABX1E860_9PROT|nr:heme ABC exporter ATP-binding protein CcmA [Falsiroseomonas selenitidurans]NKC33236.1 heme ABC exporter ATP-binding protein CcmA [Falsiroseomonas selenitidurans]
MLEAQDLACWRGDRAIFAGLSFHLPAGGALLLTGPNGAGKSSLLRLLAGLIPAAEGLLLWDGADALADLAGHARRTRYLSHQDALKPSLTAAENLAFYARLWGGQVAPALVALGLAELADLPARMLSAGQKRRLALARLALAPAPLWLLDEPTVGLDTASVARLGALLAAHRAGGGAVVAATHLPLPLPDAKELAL